MSKKIARDTIWLRSTPRLAHTEYSLNYHTEYVRAKTGIVDEGNEQTRNLYDLWDIDFLFGTNDGLHGNWGQRGRATNMGHAVYAADGSDLRNAHPSPFTTVEEVWAFDPAKEYGLPDFDEQIAVYEKSVQNAKKDFPDQLRAGGYYKTIVSGAIQAFGWEMLLMGASHRDKMAKVFERFFLFTLHHMNAWAKTSVEVIIQHDDFVWTQGAFMHPDIYRKVIIPMYAELWKPLKEAGKKVLFCSDGNIMDFAADVVEAGADGLIFEPCNDFGWLAERFGQSTVLVGSNVDCRDMAFAKWDVVKETIDRTLEQAQHCKGVIFAVGNHLPANIPEEMMDRYIDYLKQNWAR